MQVQQNAVSSTQVPTVGACPAGEVTKLKSERVQLRVGSVPVEWPMDAPVLRGRLSIGDLISLSFELDGGAFCLASDEEPAEEGEGGVPSTPVKEGDRARV